MSLKNTKTQKVKKTYATISSGRIPAGFDGFKIAHISDIHARRCPGVFELIQGEKPDIIVVTGDILDERYTEKSHARELMLKLLTVSGVYFVTGNHDIWGKDIKKELRGYCEKGAVFLDTESRLIEKNGDKIAIFGVGDSGKKNMDRTKEHIKTEFAKLPDFDGYKILLFHRANLFDEIKDYGYDLILSGHMHGGQIKLGVLGGLLAPSSALFSGKRVLFPKYTSGIYKSKKTTMLVNCGLGNTLPIPRWGNPPEVSIITLKCEK